MADPDRPLAAEAIEVITWLVTEIGPRPAGSEAERRAQAGLSERLQKFGLAPQIIPARFAPPGSFEPIYTLSAAAFIASAWLLPVFPWPAFILPLLAIELPELDGLLERRRPATQPTEDLLACPPDISPADLNIILVAHVDTAPANPPNAVWRILDLSAYPAMACMAWILALVGLLVLIGLPLPPGLLFACWCGTGLLAVGLWSLDLWELAFRRQVYVPGALDNASGVGVLVAIAQQLAAQPLPHLKTGFLFTGAEETGYMAPRMQWNGLNPVDTIPGSWCWTR